MMDLSKVAEEMTALGWTNGGRAGATKPSKSGGPDLQYGSAEWTEDMDDVIDVLKAREALAELTRRSGAD